VIQSADRDGQPYRRTVGGFEFPVQAFSERPPYLGFVVQAAGVSIGGSRMIRPTRRAVFQSSLNLVGALLVADFAGSCGLAYATWVGST
jgi:hypothetical protein